MEKLNLTGTAAINGAGNSLNNTLVGNAAANALNGSTGADTMTGGLGNDTYTVDNSGDKVIETSSLATEIDTVNSSVSYSLAGYYLEKLNLTGTAAINAAGNSLNNTLVGNVAANVLDGSTGADTITGGAGQDIFKLTTAIGASNVDTITDFAVVDDTIQLENAIFTKLTSVGVLNTGNFTIGTAADSDDFIVYNQTSGALFYDVDGNGSTDAAVQIAVLGVNLALTAADFMVI